MTLRLRCNIGSSLYSHEQEEAILIENELLRMLRLHNTYGCSNDKQTDIMFTKSNVDKTSSEVLLETVDLHKSSANVLPDTSFVRVCTFQ